MTDGATAPAPLAIAREDPRAPELAGLFASHTAAQAETPPESVHMLGPDELAAPSVAFFVMRESGHPIAMGAYKRLGARDHAEIKSMHVLAEARGRGLSRRMLAHIEAEARAAGIRRLSLETGVEPMFQAARALYARAGYRVCGPFEGYVEDPNSLFMTRELG